MNAVLAKGEARVHYNPSLPRLQAIMLMFGLTHLLNRYRVDGNADNGNADNDVDHRCERPKRAVIASVGGPVRATLQKLCEGAKAGSHAR